MKLCRFCESRSVISYSPVGQGISKMSWTHRHDPGWGFFGFNLMFRPPLGILPTFFTNSKLPDVLHRGGGIFLPLQISWIRTYGRTMDHEKLNVLILSSKCHGEMFSSYACVKGQRVHGSQSTNSSKKMISTFSL